MAPSKHLSILAAIYTLALLLASASARPSKEDLINEFKAARLALSDPKLNGKYQSSGAFMDRLILVLASRLFVAVSGHACLRALFLICIKHFLLRDAETDWNPTDDYLAKTEGKTVLLPEDAVIASVVPDAVTSTLTTPKPQPSDVIPYGNWIRANMLDGVFYQEQDIKSAPQLKNANGNSMNRTEVFDTRTGTMKVAIGKARATIRVPTIFRGNIFIMHGVDAVQPRV
ncbi:unnamed protein product [Closterium sp. Yama58-4]|nr:unnamed protein product [Closterium sp. Yama58-4]